MPRIGSNPPAPTNVQRNTPTAPVSQAELNEPAANTTGGAQIGASAVSTFTPAAGLAEDNTITFSRANITPKQARGEYTRKFSAADTAAVAAYWGLPTNTDQNRAKATYDVEVSLGRKLLDPDLGETYVRQIVAEAKQGRPSNEAELSTFLQSRYTYDDAKRIADKWDMDVGAVKVMLGSKLMNGAASDIDQLLTQASAPVQGTLPLRKARIEPWGGRDAFPKQIATLPGLTFIEEKQEKKDSVPLAPAADGTARTAEFEFSAESLKYTWKDAAGKEHQKTLIRRRPAHMNEMHEQFKSEFPPNSTPEEWNVAQRFSSASNLFAGSAGDLVSVRGIYSYYEGGAHPSNGTDLKTFNVKTGKRVKLDQLLDREDMSSVVKVVSDQLKRMKGAESYAPTDEHELRKLLNSEFVLKKGRDGKAQIHFTLPSYVHALGGSAAHFVFDAPDKTEFKTKAGL